MEQFINIMITHPETVSSDNNTQQRSVFNIAQQPILDIIRSDALSYMNVFTKIFCNGLAFDLGAAPNWPSVSNEPEYIFDMWWTLIATAYESHYTNPYFSANEHAEIIYNAYAQNYFYWEGNVTANIMHRYGFRTPMATYRALDRHEKLKFIFISELTRLLRSNEPQITSITQEQKNIYAEFTLAAADASLNSFNNNNTTIMT